MSGELMSDEEGATLLFEHGITYVAWEYFDRWLNRHRDDNPKDERGDLDLVHEFSADCEREGAK